MSNPMLLFDISPAQIDRVVQVFYTEIRAHPELGPVFNAHIAAKDWPAHEEKIARFWRNAILKERSYSGNPMRVHMQAGDVLPGHFAPWLDLFTQVLKRELPADTAAAFSALAHRIGDGLRFGLENYQRPADRPPVLI